ncbi:MAG TPA: ribokinase [Clostridiales bacterium]|jgi:ribokinase|nr:ribokinase [Clostridiales bacterium]
MSKIFVIGSVNMDLVICVDRMPKSGETLSGYGFMTNPGGKGANQAVAAAKMNAATYMVGCVGNDAFGDELQKALDDYGVNTRYLTRADSNSGIAVIIVEKGDNRIILDAGANDKIIKEKVEQALSQASEQDFCICQLEIPLDIVEHAFCLAKQKGLTTILNPAPAVKLGENILRNVDIIVLNETECEILADVIPQSQEDYKKVFEFFSGYNIKSVIITLGSKGSVLIEKDNIQYTPAFKVQAIDTTSAGDTYLGAIASELAKGKNLTDAMKTASAASALTVTKKGAMQSIPYYDEVIKFLERQKTSG